jgi:hypothetical protein
MKKLNILLLMLLAGAHLLSAGDDKKKPKLEKGGTYSNNSFVLNYTVDEGDGPIQVNATYTR